MSPPLQQELYQVVDAGDIFYELLDTVLGKPETLVLVYEVYYFCLHDGFCGRYGSNPDRITDYQEKLRKHIVLPAIIDEEQFLPPVTKKWTYIRILNRVYYGGAFLLLVLLYIFLDFVASTWNPSVVL